MSNVVAWLWPLFLVAAATPVVWWWVRRRDRKARAARSRIVADQWPRINEVMIGALALPPEARDAYVRGECSDDPALFNEVTSLVAVSERDGVLDELAASVVRPMLEGGPIQPGQQVGRYRIADKLGQGGMGVVYRAHDARLDRSVALKFLPPHASSDPEAKQRFLQEARAAAALDHPNVCTVHEIGETKHGFLFIAMPYYGEETLRGRLSRGALPVEDAVAIAMQVARGLAKAHERGIVHRDIKPANVVVTEDGVAKILDFGIAKLSSSTATRPGVQPGTVSYMSPEQAAGEPVDQRSDIWALGVVLHEMLVGRSPFGDGPAARILNAILTEEPPAPGSLRADVPALLDRIVARALTRGSAGRYADIREMAGDLEECAASAAIAEEARSRPGMAKPTASVPAEGERRSVTVLVSSIAGSVDAFDRFAPEEARAAMAALRETARRVIGSHGGIVNEVTGEEIIGLFGVPGAHEDDYVRSVRAAVELHDAAMALAPLPIRLRSGIDSGFVLARPSDGGERAFRVTGDPVRTAILLSTQAEAGDILVSPRCQRLIAPYYLTGPMPPIAGLRGESRFVPHRVLGKSGFETRLEAAGPLGLTRYTGREGELLALRNALNAAVRGQGSVVGIVGDAGLGKSRLLHEFRHGLDRSVTDVVIGRCHAHDTRTPYRPFGPILLGALGLDADRSDPDVAEATAAEIRRTLPELAHLVPLCLRLLNLPGDAHPMPREFHSINLRPASSEAIATLLTALADRKPLLVMLEDWHWADDASREALGPLVALAGTHPLLIVVTCRPDIALDWSRSVRHTTIHLDPLDDTASVAVMRSVLGADTIPTDVAICIHERTGGNPFFIEELCRALLEQDSLHVENGTVVVRGDPGALHLPETVQLVIRTRLDRLDAASRNVLRVASVIGREFDRRLLRSVCDDTGTLDASLARLRDTGLIQPLRLLPEPVFRFQHALTREVAYGSLPDHLNRSLHRRVGEALERALPERGDTSPAVLCQHFAAAEDWAKAIHWARLAAEHSNVLSRPAVALPMIERALEWLDRLPTDDASRRLRVETMLENERILHTMGEREAQRKTLDDLIDLLDRAGDSPELAEVCVRIGDFNTLTGDFDAADDALGKALRIARRLEHVGVETEARRSLAFLRWNQGRNEDARVILEHTIEIRRGDSDTSEVIGDIINLATITGRMRDYDGAIALAERALEMCEGNDLPVARVNAIVRLAFIHRDRGDFDRALEWVREAQELARHHCMPWVLGWTCTLVAEAHLRSGDVEACLADYESAIELGRSTGHLLLIAVGLRDYGMILYGTGRASDAVPVLRESAALLDQLRRREEAAQVAQVLAQALERLDDDRGALEIWHRLRAQYRRSGYGAGQLMALEGIGRTQRRIGADAAVVIATMEEAAILAERLGQARRQGELLNALGIVEFEQGNVESARSRFEMALGSFRRADDAVNEAQMTSCVAACEARLGNHDAAIARFKAAIDGHRTNGQRRLEALALGAFGDVYHASSDPANAALCYEESLRIRREIGDRTGEGWMLLSLGRVSTGGVRDGEPRRYREEAQSIAFECGDEELLAALAAHPDGSAN